MPLSQTDPSNAVKESQIGLIPLTVAVITKNEANNIAECLESVYGWADEIIVVDDESTDKTVEIASKYTNQIYHRKMDNEGIHRNWTHAQAKNEWVLIIDADEKVSAELRDEIRNILPATEYQAFAIPLRNYIGNYWVKHSGWYPASKLRLFMKSKFRYEEVGVHPRVFLDGSEFTLKGDIIHKGYPTIEHFLGSINRQTTLEAEKWLETGRKMSLGRALWRTLDRFPRRFIRKQGYKDGFVGFIIAFFDSLYQILSYIKYWELKNLRDKS